MTSEPPSGDIPPAPHLAVAAHGLSRQGARWTVKVGGTRSECWTIMEIEFPDGQKAGGGGMGGPALPAGHMVNCSVHTEDGLHYVVGRVHPAVRRVRLEFAGDPARRLDLEPTGESAYFGVAFIAAVLPYPSDLISISVWDESGHCMEHQNTEHYSAMPRQDDRPRPWAPGGEGHGWRPL
jgi:hypothetical protein